MAISKKLGHLLVRVLHCARLRRLCPWEAKVLKGVSKGICSSCALEIHEGIANVSVVFAAAAWKVDEVVCATEADRVDGVDHVGLTKTALMESRIRCIKSG